MQAYAPPEVNGIPVSQVGSGPVNDPDQEKSHQVDVAAFGNDPDGRGVLLAIGQANAGTDALHLPSIDLLAGVPALLAGCCPDGHMTMARRHASSPNCCSPLRPFAANQPFTPVIGTMRGLWMGHTSTGAALGHEAWIAVAYCAAILAVAVPAPGFLTGWRRLTRA